MVASAPTFELVAYDVLRRLDGASVVAFNAPFDQEFLTAAVERSEGTIRGPWTCALKASRRSIPGLRQYRLPDVAQHLGLGIPENLHSALADAELCAQVFFSMGAKVQTRPVRAKPSTSFGVPPLPRSATNDLGKSRRPVAKDRRLDRTDRPIDEVVSLLHASFADQLFTLAEVKALSKLVDSLGMSQGDVLAALNQFLDEQITEILSDGIIDAEERQRLRVISHHLGYPAPYIEKLLKRRAPSTSPGVLQPGLNVVFTNLSEERTWEVTSSCASIGLVPRPNLSKTTDLLVFENSWDTTKGRRALELGLPRMAIGDFMAEVARAGNAGQSSGTHMSSLKTVAGRVSRMGSQAKSRLLQPTKPEPTENLPPAGWFPDPRNRHELRWWNGSRWTDHIADGDRVGSDPL